MNEQLDARLEAIKLVANLGFEHARDFVIVRMDMGPKHRQHYWLQVWSELKSCRGL